MINERIMTSRWKGLLEAAKRGKNYNNRGSFGGSRSII